MLVLTYVWEHYWRIRAHVISDFFSEENIADIKSKIHVHKEDIFDEIDINEAEIQETGSVEEWNYKFHASTDDWDFTINLQPVKEWETIKDFFSF